MLFQRRFYFDSDYFVLFSPNVLAFYAFDSFFELIRFHPRPADDTTRPSKKISKHPRVHSVLNITRVTLNVCKGNKTHQREDYVRTKRNKTKSRKRIPIAYYYSTLRSGIEEAEKEE